MPSYLWTRWPKSAVILTQNAHDFFGLSRFCERGKAAQVAEDHRDVAAMAVEQLLFSVIENEFCNLRRKKALEPARPLDL